MGIFSTKVFTLCDRVFIGGLNYIYDMGGGTMRILVNTPKSLNDNKWHDVSLFRPQLDQQQIRVDNFPPTVEDMKGYSARHFDLKGPLYVGGLVKTRYYSLSEKIHSKKGFMGCIASFDLNGEDIDLLTQGQNGDNSGSHTVTRGCSSSEVACHEYSCHNDGRCEPMWNSYVCNCDMTSFTGPQCSDESVSYQFGLRNGLIVFEYPEDDRRSTKTDYLAFGIKTIQENAKIMRIDSAKEDDYIEVELVEGNIFMVYNMGAEDIPVVTLQQKVNDGKYHVIRFVREGSDAVLEVDRDSQRKSAVGQKMSMFNDQARIMIGGRKSSQGGITYAFHGTISGIVFNGMRILDLLNNGDPRVRSEGDVSLIETSMPKSQPAVDRNVPYNHGMQSTQGVKNTTPQGVTDDIISSSSGDGPDCYSDDEDECEVTPTDGDIITPVIIVTRTKPKHDPRETINITCTDCKTQGSEMSSILKENRTDMAPPRGTVIPKSMTTERSDYIKKSTGDSGHLNIFLIIGIVAGVLVALMILIVVFFKCRRSDEGSYRVDESQNFAYLEAKKQQSNGTTGTNVGNGKAGGKKKDVKEWYV